VCVCPCVCMCMRVFAALSARLFVVVYGYNFQLGRACVWVGQHSDV